MSTAAYEALPQHERGVINEFQRNVRAWSGELARLMNHAEALRSYWDGAASDAMALLAADDEIPPDGGGGRDRLKKSEIMTFAAFIDSTLAQNTAENRELWARMGGPDNLLG